MKVRTVNKNIYICENCGAEHSNKDNIMTDTSYGTGMEYCTKCAKKVMLANTDIFGIENISDDIGTRRVDVPPTAIKATELDLELDWTAYRTKIYDAMIAYRNLVMVIDKVYLEGKVRDFDFNVEMNL